MLEMWRTDGQTDGPTDRHGKVYSRVHATKNHATHSFTSENQPTCDSETLKISIE